ncbi:MAG: hypothetical protein HQL12_08440 [Candidatus Omnitrophica bacterium]|nr:hypothetical protein [Candidatus Omnitrophota bacterium]
MNIEVFSLCDAATVDIGGKLNVLGAFDTIWTANIPVLYPQCAIAFRVRFENIEQGEHRVTVNFVDLDGKHILPGANGTIKIAFPDEQRSGSANLVFNIQMLKLENYGEYSIDLAVDSRKEASLPLFVRERK